ncbi:hypothetical protein H257_06743 [Aphanomyces astaci]|uniref:Hexose transporter 1 n=2 Tax=Aphanomyces astaci TaxID=112090 RepID=W4GLC7_APHAT|nr:hypothetical protein H257_06743 [Aphanomyces astaci]ETV80472.1 hypothetical protein H257_06743 [Aphanomyces astaci]|eukprot:XP_009830396.1 hypothetical protein H257_06743 [Aphanomyces astaci]
MGEVSPQSINDPLVAEPTPTKEEAAAAAPSSQHQPDQDVYVPIQDSPQSRMSESNRENGLSRRTLSRSSTRSYRASRRSTSRVRLSRLESMLHEEHSKALVPSAVLWVTVGIALIGAFQFGWLLSQLNYKQFNAKCSAPVIQKGNCLVFPGHSSTEWTMAVTSWIVGGAIGAMASGYPADKYGRKRTLFLNALVMIVGAAVQVMSTDIYTFSIGRVISGIASGAAINVCNVLISEISPCQMRGMFSTGLQVGVAVGSLAVTTAHYALNAEAYAWRILVGFPAVLGGLQVLLMPFVTLSPVWLVAHGHIDDAGVELTRLYRPTNTQAILNALVAAHEEERKESSGVNPWKTMFSSKYRKQLVIAIVLCSAQQLCGINAVMYYSSSIFASAGVDDPRVGNTIVNVVRTSMIILAAYVMDKFHRRTLLMGGMSVMAVAAVGIMLSLSYQNAIVSVVSTGLFVGAFCLSIGPMGWMVSSEIFPDFLHANAGSIGTMFTWLGNFIVGVLYPTLSAPDSLGAYAFSIFVALLVGFVLFVCIVVPETGHKTYVEIQESFGIHEHHDVDVDVDEDPWACDDDELPKKPF